MIGLGLGFGQEHVCLYPTGWRQVGRIRYFRFIVLLIFPNTHSTATRKTYSTAIRNRQGRQHQAGRKLRVGKIVGVSSSLSQKAQLDVVFEYYPVPKFFMENGVVTHSNKSQILYAAIPQLNRLQERVKYEDDTEDSPVPSATSDESPGMNIVLNPSSIR